MITVYSVLKESKINFTREDCGRIGVAIREDKSMPAYKDKIEQTETYNGESRKMKVRAYPEELTPNIQEFALKYFSEKYAEQTK